MIALFLQVVVTATDQTISDGDDITNIDAKNGILLLSVMFFIVAANSSDAFEM